MAKQSVYNKHKNTAVKSLWLIAAVILAFCIAAPSVYCDTISETHVKAVFLYNLINFVEWPARAFYESQSPFTIGVLGTDPFGKVLDRTVENENIGGRSIEVVRYAKTEDVFVRRCQILFVSADQMQIWKKLGPRLKAAPVLTVADLSGFTRQGGMINLRKMENQIHVEINLANTRGTGLVISAKLLNVARLVGPDIE